MKTSVMSLSPIERTNWRCVPSPQSKSRRSPPRRTSSAGSPRRAVGADPAVPAKKSERSMVRGVPSVVAALAAALALALLVPAGVARAAAGPQPGVVASLPLTGGDYARVRDSGVKVVRLFMFTGDYNDAGFRVVVDRLAGLGVKPLFVVVGD